MSDVKVVSLADFKKQKTIEKAHTVYEDHIRRLSKLELLEEMVKFQESRSQLGYLTEEMMVQGKTLFQALENHAETDELRSLARSYQRHLKLELEALQSKKTK